MANMKLFELQFKALWAGNRVADVYWYQVIPQKIDGYYTMAICVPTILNSAILVLF